ncbi:MAG: hypothetical protein Tsb0020_15710 [Haliangiales bacterium]
MLVLASLAGVLILVAISWLAGGMQDAALHTAEDAQAQARVDHPNFAAERVLLGRDRRAALVADERGAALMAITTLGDRFVTRRLRPGSLQGAAVTDDGRAGRALVLTTSDLTCRTISIALDPAGDAADDLDFWLAASRRLVTSSHHGD